MASRDQIQIRDDLGDELTLDDVPRRIVSLVPSVTETVIALGAADRLAGVTNYCVYPADIVKDIPKVGGTKGFSFESIDAARPDLILANKEENRKHQIEKLRERYPVFVTYPRTVEQAIKMILDLGVLTGTEERASELAASCDHFLESMEPAIAGPPLRTACMIWRDPWMAVGPDSYVSALLDRVGFVNVFTEADGRYPETTLDAVIERRPEVIILPSEPYEFGKADQEELDRFLEGRGVAATTLRMDGSLLTWFGSRTLKGLRFFYETKARLLRASP
jgi:ABC-type Fe3+-hydroxamate transport system substrate-binding protein